MGYNKYRVLFIILLIGVSTVLVGQEKSSSGAVSQRIFWDEISYASSYEIVIEKFDEIEQWKPYEIYRTQENELILFLAAGLYRYSIVVFNPLNKAEPASPWFELSINKAIQPVVKKLLTKQAVLPEANRGQIAILAENISDKTVLNLVHSNGTIIKGTIVSYDNDVVHVDFDEELFEKGTYVLEAINPGGLVDSSKRFRVKDEESYDMYLTAGYVATAFAPGGEIVPQLVTTFLPVGFRVAFDYSPFNVDYGELGFGASFVYVALKQQAMDYNVHGDLFPISVNARYKHFLVKDKLYFNIYLGGGLMYLHDWYTEDVGSIQKAPLQAIGISPMAGISFQVLLSKSFFVELGFDYYATFFLGDTYLQMLMPTAAMGLRF